jgi:hypothetical protein
MLKSTVMSTSLFLLLKVALGINNPGKDDQVAFRENEPANLAGTLIITVQPVDQTDCKGNKVTYMVVADGGTGTIHYQWQRKRPADAGFASFGARDSTKLPVYNIGVGTDAPDGTLYQVVVTDQNSVLTSGHASLKVNQITGISPVGVATYTINEGENLWLKVLTSGNLPSAYQWIKKLGPNNWGNLADNSIISGSLQEQINFSKISVADSGIYKIRVTYPTINGNLCTETSSITRTVHVIPDTEPPTFVNLNNQNRTLCPEDLAVAEWGDSLSDILPIRTNFYRLHHNSTSFDLSPIQFSDNLSQPAELILHWGIYSSTAPFAPIADESGTLLDNRIGQISLHPSNIRFETSVAGSQTCQIIFWLEDRAGNLTPSADRHVITVTIPPRPEIICSF